jgi:hypothetical protein
MISRSLSTSAKFNVALPKQASGTFIEFSQLLYLMILPHTDDFGRMPGDAEAVKLECLPASRRSFADVGKALRHLHAVGLIIWYEVEGKKYIQISDFQAHQTGLHRRTKSRFPEFPGNSGKFLAEVEVEVEVEGEGEGRRGRPPHVPPEDPPPEQPGEKIAFAPLVHMTREEHAALVTAHGERAVAWMIDRLDAFKGSKGKAYKDDARAIRSWVVDAWKDHLAKHPGDGGTPAPGPALPPKPKCPKCEVRAAGAGGLCAPCASVEADRQATAAPTLSPREILELLATGVPA